ncbi:hypothetical protein [Corynebacterium endometrii]|uniref:Inner membrane protein YjdF n=1 Tax=Corynebacterium endometrii TaxID=2488819 RepID=A0A4P7QDH1_9CORY|nr:hypothetical protein [Corynebacterium endometrii]QCB27429.1 hypothetical protein CENDO_00595 [Corynebacterium endometrii]
MIDNFLRPPRTATEWLADIARVLATLLTFVLLFQLGIFEAGIMAFALPGLMLPKFMGLSGAADLFSVTVILVAALSNIFGLYATIPGWDLVVHAVCTAVIATIGYLLLARLGLLPMPEAREYTAAHGLIFSTMIGLALGAAWEMVEWIGFRFTPADVMVDYDDTVTDLFADALGALIAGAALARLRVLKPPRDA